MRTISNLCVLMVVVMLSLHCAHNKVNTYNMVCGVEVQVHIPPQPHSPPHHGPTKTPTTWARDWISNRVQIVNCNIRVLLSCIMSRILECGVTHNTIVVETAASLIPSNTEEMYPGTDCNTNGLSPEMKSFLWKLMENLIVTRELLHRMKKSD